MKQPKITLPEGWLDAEKIRSYKRPFNFIWSQRGRGKTYGFLLSCLKNNEKFVLMRRTETELNTIANDSMSPFNPIIKDHPEIEPITIKSIPNVRCAKMLMQGEKHVGFAVAVATARNIRGFDMSDCKVIIYDEFIPQEDARPIPGEAMAFFNAYETISRNREILGQEPVYAYILGNSNRVDNALFVSLGLVNRAFKMQENCEYLNFDDNRGYLLCNFMTDDEFTERKAQTALYKLVGENSEFAQMALKNQFLGFDSAHIAQRNLTEYKILCKIGEICIYKHKSRAEYYVTHSVIGTPKRFTTSTADLKNANRKYYYLSLAYLNDHVLCEDAACKVIFEKYFGLS